MASGFTPTNLQRPSDFFPDFFRMATKLVTHFSFVPFFMSLVLFDSSLEEKNLQTKVGSWLSLILKARLD